MARHPICLALVSLVLASPQPRHPHSAVPDPARVVGFSPPLAFESNQGRFDASVKFFARAGRCEVFLTSREAVVKTAGMASPIRTHRPSGRSIR